jgi:hypothetical protein
MDLKLDLFLVVEVAYETEASKIVPVTRQDIQ